MHPIGNMHTAKNAHYTLHPLHCSELLFFVMNNKSFFKYLLFPEARIWCCVLITMEQSTPHSTRWASKSAGKFTCWGEWWQSWVPEPSRPVRLKDIKREKAKICLEAILSTRLQREILWNTPFNWQMMALVYHCLLCPRRKPLAHWSQPVHEMLHKTLEPTHNQGEPPLSWAKFTNSCMRKLFQEKNH